MLMVGPGRCSPFRRNKSKRQSLALMRERLPRLRRSGVSFTLALGDDEIDDLHALEIWLQEETLDELEMSRQIRPPVGV
jgi:hypothetical protein